MGKKGNTDTQAPDATDETPKVGQLADPHAETPDVSSSDGDWDGESGSIVKSATESRTETAREAADRIGREQADKQAATTPQTARTPASAEEPPLEPVEPPQEGDGKPKGDKEGEGGEASAEGAEGAEEAEEDADKGKRKSPGEQRIQRLQDQINKRTRELRELERRIQEKAEQNAADQKTQKVEEAVSKEPPPPDDPEPTLEAHKGDWEAFDKAWRSWTTRQVQRAAQAEKGISKDDIERMVDERANARRAEEVYEAQSRRLGEKLTAAAEKDPELDARMRAAYTDSEGNELQSFLLQRVFMETEQGADLVIGLTETPEKIAVLASLPTPSQALADVIVGSPEVTGLIQHFGDNPEVFERLVTLHPIDAVREIGRLEARVGSATKTSSGSEPAAKPLKAPPPPPKPQVDTPQARTAPRTTTEIQGTDDDDLMAHYEITQQEERQRRRSLG